MVVYLDGRFLPLDEAALSPRDRGIQFADGAYEVIRSYNGVLFELDAHLARLRRSLRELRIDPSPADGLGAVCAELLERNELRETDARVYLHVTRGTYPRGHAFPPPDVAPNVYAEASSFEPHREVQLHGVSVITYPDQRWARCDIKSLALLPNVLALQAAREQGAQEAVLLRDGIVTEATHSSVAAVNEDTVIAPPLTNYVLPSITRQVVYRLCEQEGIPFVADILSAEQLRGADEAMLWGTGYEVTPITEIDRTPVGTGAPGPVTRRLQHAFRDYVARHTSSAAAEARRQPNPDPPPG
jgi:D-alanine transaminase